MAQLAFPVQSEESARAAIATMRQNCGSADHNISAFRVGTVFGKMAAGSDDDGEDRAGGKLLGVLKTENAVGVAMLVSRWFGGVNLGQARFTHICNAAKELLVDTGQMHGVPVLGTQEDWGSGHSLTSSSTQSGTVPVSAEERRALQAAAAERRAGKVVSEPAKSVQASEGEGPPAPTPNAPRAEKRALKASNQTGCEQVSDHIAKKAFWGTQLLKA